MQNRRMSKMKCIVKTIPVRIADIVGHRIPYKDTIPPKICTTRATLINRDLELLRKAFFRLKCFVEVRQARVVRFNKSSSSLSDVGAGHICESDTRRFQSSQIPISEGR